VNHDWSPRDPQQRHLKQDVLIYYMYYDDILIFYVIAQVALVLLGIVLLAG
jgi:hypothetical protein